MKNISNKVRDKVCWWWVNNPWEVYWGVRDQVSLEVYWEVYREVYWEVKEKVFWGIIKQIKEDLKG